MAVVGADVVELTTPQALLEFEQLTWHQFVDSLPIGIYTCDKSGRVVRFNEKAAQLWGRSPEGSAGGAYCGAWKAYRLDGEPISPDESPMAELLASGKRVRGRELMIERPDGSRIYIEANLDPIVDSNGEIIGGVNCFQDITSRKQSERDLAQILGALPVAVYTTDAEGRITSFNEAAVSLWGQRPELGAAQWCGSWRLRDMDGNVLPHDQCPMAQAVNEDRDIQWGRAIAERPDGTLVPFVAFPTPLRNAAGTLIGAVNTLIDISDQQRAADLGIHMAAIVESSMDAIISKDLNGIITSWNPAAVRLFGYQAEEAIGKSVLMLIPEGQQDEETLIIQRIRRGERVETYETTRRHKDGHHIPVSLTISPVRNAAGHIVGASKIARDITNSKDSERRIRLLMREVNHRVKNQYSVILAMIRESGKRSSDPSTFERQVRERIMALSDSHDLLVSADWSGATISDLLQAQLRPFANSERVSVSGPLVLLNPNAVQYLGIAFHELATNATKHGALSVPGGRIEVKWRILPGAQAASRFELVWRELGGRMAAPEAHSGFGTIVLKRVAPQAMNGSGELSYDGGGATWRLEAPLNDIVSRDT
jgi:PAS domain S-box-containing protein